MMSRRKINVWLDFLRFQKLKPSQHFTSTVELDELSSGNRRQLFRNVGFLFLSALTEPVTSFGGKDNEDDARAEAVAKFI